jgi:hypothetical protein
MGYYWAPYAQPVSLVQENPHATLHLLASWLCTVSLLVPLLARAETPYTLPPERTQGIVTYRSGGIGQDEAQAFAVAVRHYPLTLEFAV